MGHTFKFLFGIYWYTWKTTIYCCDCNGPIKNNNFNIDNVQFKKQNQGKHLEILFYTYVPKILMIWSTVPEIWNVTNWKQQFWIIFCLFTPLKCQKIRILKKWKKWPEISFYTCLLKILIIRCTVAEIRSETDRILSFWASFCPYSPPPISTRKIKILKKLKKQLQISF